MKMFAPPENRVYRLLGDQTNHKSVLIGNLVLGSLKTSNSKILILATSQKHLMHFATVNSEIIEQNKNIILSTLENYRYLNCSFSLVVSLKSRRISLIPCNDALYKDLKNQIITYYLIDIMYKKETHYVCNKIIKYFKSLLRELTTAKG